MDKGVRKACVAEGATGEAAPAPASVCAEGRGEGTAGDDAEPQAQGVQETGRTLIVNHAIRNIREGELVVCDPKLDDLSRFLIALA